MSKARRMRGPVERLLYVLSSRVSIKVHTGAVRRGYMTSGGIFCDADKSEYRFSELFTWKLYGVVFGRYFLGVQKRVAKDI